MRVERRELLKRIGAGATVLTLSPLIQAFEPTKTYAESGTEEVSDLTYSEFLTLLPHPENPQNLLKDLSKTIRITLDKDVRIVKSDELFDLTPNSGEKFLKSLFWEEATRGNLVYIFIPEESKEKSIVFTRGKALKFEQLTVSEEIAIKMAKRSIIPLVFRGETEPPLPLPCPMTPPQYEMPCNVPIPANYASNH